MVSQTIYSKLYVTNRIQAITQRVLGLPQEPGDLNHPRRSTTCVSTNPFVIEEELGQLAERPNPGAGWLW
jgi:hypothetical protein